MLIRGEENSLNVDLINNDAVSWTSVGANGNDLIDAEDCSVSHD